MNRREFGGRRRGPKGVLRWRQRDHLIAERNFWGNFFGFSIYFYQLGDYAGVFARAERFSTGKQPTNGTIVASTEENVVVVEVKDAA